MSNTMTKDSIRKELPPLPDNETIADDAIVLLILGSVVEYCGTARNNADETGLGLALGNSIGGWYGAHTTIHKGEVWIRRVFYITLSAFVIKLLFF